MIYRDNRNKDKYVQVWAIRNWGDPGEKDTACCISCDYRINDLRDGEHLPDVCPKCGRGSENLYGQ